VHAAKIRFAARELEQPGAFIFLACAG